MKTFISKGTGIGLETRKKIKTHPDTKLPIRGQLQENKYLLVEGQKYWSGLSEDIYEFYGDVFFIFNFLGSNFFNFNFDIFFCFCNNNVNSGFILL